jgi:hypothetical protein
VYASHHQVAEEAQISLPQAESLLLDVEKTGFLILPRSPFETENESLGNEIY